MKSELENIMLKPAILALIRQILTVAGTALVAKGYVQASDIEPVIGALLTIGSVMWSVADKRGRTELRRYPCGRAIPRRAISPESSAPIWHRRHPTSWDTCVVGHMSADRGGLRAGSPPSPPRA
jgi:hypothetical protein